MPRSLPRPDNTEKCDDENCKHTFGLHWSTYDGRATGCSAAIMTTNQRHEEYESGKCRCKGFMIRYVYISPAEHEAPPRGPSSHPAYAPPKEVRSRMFDQRDRDLDPSDR